MLDVPDDGAGVGVVVVGVALVPDVVGAEAPPEDPVDPDDPVEFPLGVAVEVPAGGAVGVAGARVF